MTRLAVHTCVNEKLYSWTLLSQGSVATEFRCGGRFILPHSVVYLRIQKWKNYWNRSTFAKVIVKIKVARFYGPRCIFQMQVILVLKIQDIWHLLKT